MNKNLRWKVLTIVVVTVLASLVSLSTLPAHDDAKRSLGLDLKGGVHLVLRVQTDDALRLETQTTMERLREELTKGAITFTNISLVSPTQFRVEGVPPRQDPDFRRIADEHSGATFNREAGVGQRYTFSIKPNITNTLRQETVEQARQTIDRRVNELGVAEPIVAPHGSAGDQILVQLPGVTDVARAKEIIRSTALLELKLVEQGPSPTREALLQATGGTVPPDMDVVSGPTEGGAPGERPARPSILVRKIAAVTGRDLRNARPSLDEDNQPAVSFSLNQEGARKFAKVTGDNVGRNLAIILDGRVQSAPRIDSRISDEGRISGSFTTQEAQDLSLVLRSGALPASLTYLEQREVGPSLGADSIRAGVLASVTGLALVGGLHAHLLQGLGHQRHSRGGR